jgi:hypothetical protein
MTGADAVVAIIPTAAVALLGWMGKNALGRYTDRWTRSTRDRRSCSKS